MRLYDLNSGDLNSGQFRKFEAQAEPKVIRFSRDGHTLLIADKDGKIELIDTENLKLKCSLVSLFFPGIVDLDSLPDGRIVSANEYEGAVQVWPGDGQSRLPHWYAGGLPYALSHDGRELAVAQADGTVRRFDLNENRELPRLPAQSLTEAAGAVGGRRQQVGIAGLCYSTTPGTLLVAYSDSHHSNLGTRQPARVIASVGLICPAVVTRPGPYEKHEPYLAHKSGFFGSILFSDDGKYAAWDGHGQDKSVGRWATTLMVWELPSGARHCQ